MTVAQTASSGGLQIGLLPPFAAKPTSLAFSACRLLFAVASSVSSASIYGRTAGMCVCELLKDKDCLRENKKEQ